MGCLVPARSRRCGDITCVNWPYRMNVNPFRTKRHVTETQRAALNGHVFPSGPDIIRAKARNGRRRW
jgi:hypothetical protein